MSPQVMDHVNFWIDWYSFHDAPPAHSIVQVRLLFRPRYQNHNCKSRFIPWLAYVQRFKVVPQLQEDMKLTRTPDPVTRMHVLQRACHAGGERVGGIIDVRSIRMPAEVVPRFGTATEPTLTTHTALERSTEFFLNKFSTKDLFSRLEAAL